MKIANINDRAVIVNNGLAVDIFDASKGQFGPTPRAVYEKWKEFQDWAAKAALPPGFAYQEDELGAPVPDPRQVFAVGLNYSDHARESGLEPPEHPLVFTKFASSFSGPVSTVTLTGDRVDWEAELVAVIGHGGRDIETADAWRHVAGLAVGQDITDRTVQWQSAAAQFSMGKSFAGFAPFGPSIVSVDELSVDHDPDALKIRTKKISKDGQEHILQDGTTADLIFTIPRLVSELSAIVELLPGDVIFTGTPAGVGMGMDPQTFLKTGDILMTEIEGLGSLTQTFVSGKGQ